jgi:precorrin-2 dehydrogenase/sirohydrochlorin ferrochelatase
MEPLPAYPIVLTNLGRALCVVVGGGAVAERKARDLLAGGGRPLLISPSLSEGLASLLAAGAIAHRARPYQPGDLQGAFLAIAATDDAAVNAAVADEGAALGILVNVADAPDAGNFHTVAAVRRGDLLLAVSTGGASPALAAQLRRDLAVRYGEGYGPFLALLRRLRQGPARALSPSARAALWERLMADDMLALVERGELEAVETYAREQVALLAAP